jgi:hypothetical protein
VVTQQAPAGRGWLSADAAVAAAMAMVVQGDEFPDVGPVVVLSLVSLAFAAFAGVVFRPCSTPAAAANRMQPLRTRRQRKSSELGR